MKTTTKHKDFLTNTAWGSSWGRSKKIKHCCYCEKQVPITQVTREHIIPKSKGGKIIKPCCLECNREKADRLPIDWVIYLYAVYFNVQDKKAKIRLRNATNYLLALYPGEYDFIFKQ